MQHSWLTRLFLFCSNQPVLCFYTYPFPSPCVFFALRTRWGFGDCSRLAEWLEGSEAAQAFVEKGYDFTWGSYTEGLRRHGNANCTWFTIFRHPVDRVGE